jgi:hypothetical protein
MGHPSVVFHGMDYAYYAVHAVRAFWHSHRVDPYCRPKLYAKGDPVQCGN